MLGLHKMFKEINAVCVYLISVQYTLKAFVVHLLFLS